MRDRLTMRAALGAAETGHLVFASLHTGDAPQTIDRIVDAFEGDAQGEVRTQLAQVLVAVVCQRLVRRASGVGRRAAAEVMIVNDAIRTLIRDRRTHHIRNSIATGRQAGMQTLEQHLAELVAARDIEMSEAHRATDRPDEVRVLAGATA
jgi:twitching motility protein PilT